MFFLFTRNSLQHFLFTRILCSIFRKYHYQCGNGRDEHLSCCQAVAPCRSEKKKCNDKTKGCRSGMRLFSIHKAHSLWIVFCSVALPVLCLLLLHSRLCFMLDDTRVKQTHSLRVSPSNSQLNIRCTQILKL